MNYVPRPPTRFPTGSFAHRMGLRPGDERLFAPLIRIAADKIVARHVDADGKGLGWEVYREGVGGGPLVTYTRGAPKGLVISHMPPMGSVDVVLVEGTIAALAAAALDPGDGPLPRVFIAIGGFWNRDVANRVAALRREIDTPYYGVAFSAHHPAGQQMRRAAVADLTSRGIAADYLPVPTNGWRAALVEARLGPSGLSR